MDFMTDIMSAILNATSLDESLIRYLKSTTLAEFVVSTPWVWPAAETFHFLGLALLFGSIAPLDFRLLGFMRHLPVSAFRALVPWAVAGFGINLVTGAIFLVAAPDQYLRNISWWFKVLFLIVAGLNILLFNRVQESQADAMAPGAHTSPVLKMIGGVSLVSWFLVLYFGRMLAFLGNAF